MTKQELSQLFYLNKEIKKLQEQLDTLNRALDHADMKTFDSVKGSSPSFPYVLHSIRLEGYSEDMTSMDRNKIMRLKAEITDVVRLIEINNEKYIYEYSRLNRFISTVEDSQMRQILRLRYMDGLGWEKVAAGISANLSGESVRKAHDRFLKKT
jgi:hypothetical protein